MAIAEIGATLTAISTALDIGKRIASTDSALEAATLKLQLADLMHQLANAKISMLGVMEQVELREKEIARLNGALEKMGTVVKRYAAYYDANESGQATGDPWCMNCWEQNHLLAHLVPAAPGETHVGCPRCKTKYPKRLASPIGDY